MGWSIGFDDNWNRDVGYGVPAWCDHPGCNAEIDRGLAYVCCGEQPYGGENGCGLYFCGAHRGFDGKCERCAAADPERDINPAPFDPKPEHPRWIAHVLTDASWATWRHQNPKRVEEFRASTPLGSKE